MPASAEADGTEAAGPGEFQFHRRREWRRIVDHRPARGARARAVRAASARAPRRAVDRAAHARADDGRVSPRQLRDFRTHLRRADRQRLRSGADGTAQRGHSRRAGRDRRADAERLLMEILDGIERENAAVSMDTLQAKIAASTACHAAIKVNMPLEQKKMEWLLAELAKTEAPMSCPHGRPVVLRYSVREIERAFKRI